MRVQLGAGASAAARDPHALLVDERLRWQSDNGTHIAQPADQLRNLNRTGLGDPYQFAGRYEAGPDGQPRFVHDPGARVPLDALRLWEDGIAAQGPVVDGRAELRIADGRAAAGHHAPARRPDHGRGRGRAGDLQRVPARDHPGRRPGPRVARLVRPARRERRRRRRPRRRRRAEVPGLERPGQRGGGVHRPGRARHPARHARRPGRRVADLRPGLAPDAGRRPRPGALRRRGEPPRRCRPDGRTAVAGRRDRRYQHQRRGEHAAAHGRRRADVRDGRPLGDRRAAGEHPVAAGPRRVRRRGRSGPAGRQQHPNPHR